MAPARGDFRQRHQRAPQTTTNVFTGAPSLEPLQQFVHDGGGEAVIGGYVYHGPVSELQGTYFYTDFVGTSAGAQIWSLNFDRNTSTGSYDGNNGTNTDVSALWQSLVYDPTDPTYTPDSTTGSSRGLDHIVSFGEDNAGNLYLVDFGNGSGFDGQYPAAGLGEIFKVVPTLAIKVTVDRVTGAMTFANAAGAPVDVRGYSISSTAGAISSSDLTPITDRLDAPPGGDGSINPTNDWQITSTPGDHALFSEASTGGAASLSTAESFELSPAGGWLKSIYEDLDLQVTLDDGSVVAGIVDYTGNGGSPWARSDLNFNGQLDPGDWTIFRTHHLQDMSGLSLAQSYQLGDLNGDGVNDFTDFRMFQADYTAENGAAAFAALLKVPEPSTLALLVLGCTAVFVRRTSRGHRRPAERDGRFQLAHVRNRLSHVSILSVLAVAALLPLRANAEIRNRYSFAEGPTADASGRTIVDSISGANGVVRGSGSSATAGELVLPGGSSASRAYVDLPNGMISSLTDATFEAWYTMTTARSWGRIFDFGSTAGGELTGPGGGGEGQDYIFYAASRGTDQNTQRAGMRNLDPAFGGSDAGTVGTGEAPQMDPNLGYTLGTQRHVAVVFDSTGGSAPGLASVALYIDGVPAPGVVNPADTPFQLGNLNDVNNWLGRSNWTGDSNFEGSFNEFRIYDNALTAEDVLADFNAGPDTLPAPPNFLNLQVNTRTGAVTIMNNVPSSPIDLDYYRITSPSGALNLAGWNSLDSQDVDAIGAGEGESWDETGAANASQLAELYLLGHSTATTAHELSLGKAYDPSFFPPGADGDLIFQYGVVGKNNLVTGTITYFTPPPLLGDYNDDGTVDAADYTVWRDHLNTAYQLPNETTGVTPGNVTIEDYQQWKLHFGETLAGSGSAGVAVAVPEPTAALLWAVAVVVPSVIGTRSGRS